MANYTNFITFIPVFILSGHINHKPRRISIIWFKALILYSRMEGYCQKAVNYKFRILKKVFGNLKKPFVNLIVFASAQTLLASESGSCKL